MRCRGQRRSGACARRCRGGVDDVGIVFSGSGGVQTLDVRVNANADDAEEGELSHRRRRERQQYEEGWQYALALVVAEEAVLGVPLEVTHCFQKPATHWLSRNSSM